MTAKRGSESIAEPSAVVDVASDSLAGDVPEPPAPPAEGFVRCVHPDVELPADLPIESLGLNRAKGWVPVDELTEAPVSE